MSISVRVVNRIPAYQKSSSVKMHAAIRKAAFEIEARAKGKAPVLTGHLRGTINANGGGLSWRVDAPASYAIFVELGTSRMGAQPFLVPALEEVKPMLMAALRSL